MLIHNENFNIKQIADSGQCFRMNRMEDIDGKIRYSLVAYDRYLALTQIDEETVELSCSEEELHEIWEDYFDLKYDYDKLVKELAAGEDKFLKQAAEFGKGIRILKQEPFEATISFIISQNKNIPAIRSCIEALCSRYGERRTSEESNGKEYTAFPSPAILAAAQKEELRTLKTGYRDEYILQAAKAVVEGSINFDLLKKSEYGEAVKALKGIHGIGEKVANCIALYGLHQIDGFPMDVWIIRILKDIYQNKFDKGKYSGYAGIVQQYMFYYYRQLKGV